MWPWLKSISNELFCQFACSHIKIVGLNNAIMWSIVISPAEQNIKVVIISMPFLSFMSLLFHIRYITKYEVSWRAVCVFTGMFPPLNILLEYWIEHVTFGLLYVILTFPTMIFYRGVPGHVWCHGLATCLLYVSPLFWKSSLKWWKVCKLYIKENNFFAFFYCCTYM